MAKRRKSDLPFGSQFSPSQIDLSEVLEMADTAGGTTSEFTRGIQKRFFASHAKGDTKQQQELAKNVRLALREYGIVGDEEEFTDFGRSLLEVRSDKSRLYDAFAGHILLNLRGLDVLRAIVSLKALREEPTLLAIADELERAGVHVPPSGTHISSMKQWLQKAGVLDEDLNVDEERLRELIGYGLQEVDLLSTFGSLQKSFIRALVALAPKGWTSSADVARFAEARYHVRYNPKDLRHQVIFPLGDAGYLENRKATAGRGAKPYEVRPTEKFRAEFLLPLLESIKKVGGVSVELLQKPLPEVVADLRHPGRSVKGKALELLTMHLCRLLGLRLVAWRHRWRETGGAEVDVIAEGTNLVFVRWEIQCKNTPRVSLEDLAKEIGIADFYHANVVMMVTTGKFAKPAIDFAERKMERSGLNIILLDGPTLQQIVKRPHSMGDVLSRFAQRAMTLKRLKDVGRPGSANG